MIDCYVKLMVEQPALFVVYFREKNFLTASHCASAHRMERKILRVLEDIYVEEVQSGEFRDGNPAVSVLGILGMYFWSTTGIESAARFRREISAKSFERLRFSELWIRPANQPDRTASC